MARSVSLFTERSEITTRKTTMMISDLTSDLESEILCRVPAKSLWKLKTTCKRWHALFTDPKFVEKNKRLSKAPRESILLSKHEVYSIAGDLHSSIGFDTPVKLTGKLRNLIKVSDSSEDNKVFCLNIFSNSSKKEKNLKGSEDLNFSHIFHCDGLMLCSDKVYNRFVVWNPCTGQTRKIKPRTCYRYEDRFALGYSRSSSSSGLNSYKILKYRYHRNKQNVGVAECEIYELSSDSWRVLGSFTLYYYLYFNGMSLKGDTYWVAGHERDETSFFLMKFDFAAERFVRLSLPPLQSFKFLDAKVLSVVRDEKLAVLHIDDRSNVMRIWVSNKIDEDANKDLSWRSDLVLEVDSARFHLSVENFLLDEENKVAVCCDKFTSDGDRTMVYIVGEDMYKQVYEDTRIASPINWPLVITYVPNLVPIH